MRDPVGRLSSSSEEGAVEGIMPSASRKAEASGSGKTEMEGAKEGV